MPVNKPLKIKQSNKTREYINSFGPNHPGNQGFWGEALTDIPNPSKPGETMNYSQFRDHLKSPEFLANPEYNDEAKRTAYGEQVFKDAQTRFYKRADQSPNEYIFPPTATEALNKPVDEFVQKTGGYSTPENGKVSDSSTESQRFAGIKDRGVSTINKTYRKGTSKIEVKEMKRKVLKSKSNTFNSSMQKASTGFNNVVVPEKDAIVSNGISGGIAGASAGSSAGPYGALIGAGVGFISSTYKDALNPTRSINERKGALLTNRNNQINRTFDGDEATINQKMQAYKKGGKSLKKKPSKLIEAEHNEHVFDKDLNHKGIVKGNTHEKGGEVISVDKGDSIFPANQKREVDKHLKTGNKTGLKKLRSKLPKDTNQKKAAFGLYDEQDPNDTPDPVAYGKRNPTIKPVVENGAPLYADNRNRSGQYGNYQSAVDGLQDGSSTYLNIGAKGNPYPYSVVKNSQGTMYKHNQIIPQLKTVNPFRDGNNLSTSSPTISSSTPLFGNEKERLSINNPGEGESTTNEQGDTSNAMNNVGKYANIVNNSIRGLKSPKPIEQNYLDPTLLKYTDRSETQRRDSRSNQSVSNSNARNLSGGNVSNIRANEAAAGTTNLENQDAINEKEMNRADAVDNANVEIKNRAKEINLNRKDAYQDQYLRSKAAQENYQNAAVQEAASQAEVNERDNYARSRDIKLDNLEDRKLKLINQTTKYKVNKNDEVEYNPSSTTSGFNSSSPKSTTKVTTDKKGQQSSTVTTTEGGDNTKNPLTRRLKKRRSF